MSEVPPPVPRSAGRPRLGLRLLGASLLLPSVVLLGGACAPGQEATGALRIVLHVDEVLRADCVEVEVAGQGVAPQRTLVALERGKPSTTVGLLRGALPEKVTVEVAALVGSCQAAAVRALASRAGPVVATFPLVGVKELHLRLTPPNALLDADRDGYTSAREGGPDCDDADVLISPGRPQRCASPVDSDCDRALYCDDADCAAEPPCTRRATRLTFVPSTLEVVFGGCAHVELGVADALGLALPGRPVEAELSHDSRLQFYSDAACEVPVARVALAFGQATVRVYLRGPDPTLGAVDAWAIDASAGARLDRGNLTVTGVRRRLVVENAPASLAAGECSPELSLRLKTALGQYDTAASVGTVRLVAQDAGAAGLTFFVSADGGTGCDGGVASASLSQQLDANSYGFNFHLRPSKVGVVTLEARAERAQPDSISLTIVPGRMRRFALSAPAGVAQAGECVGPIALELRDVAENLTPSGARVDVDLAGSGAAPVAFFSDGACGRGPTRAVTVLAGETGTTFSLRATKAGPLTLTASQGSAPGAPTGALSLTVVPATPVRMAFTSSSPGMVSRFACTAGFALQVFDGFDNPTGAPAAERWDLRASTEGVEFYERSDGGCVGSASASVAVAAGQLEVGFDLVALGRAEGLLQLTARSPSLGAASRSVWVADGKGALTVEAPAAVEPGACLPVAVSRRRADGALVRLGETVVVLSPSPDGGLSTHDDPACASVGPARAVLDAGLASATLYVRGHSSDAPWEALTATAEPADFVDGLARVRPLPLVRRGDCTIPTGSSSVECVLDPPLPGNDLSRTFLVYQAAPSASTPSDATVACHLTLGARVRCERVGSSGAATAHWQTASWGRGAAAGGVSVQHAPFSLAGSSPFSRPLAASVDAGASFALFGSASAGVTVDGSHFFTAGLLGASGLTVSAGAGLEFPAQALASVQVVEFFGAVVARGTLSNAGQGAAILSVSTPTMDPARALPLFTARLGSIWNDEPLCSRRFRGAQLDASTLRFSRGARLTPRSECTTARVEALEWQRVEFPRGTTVEAVDVSMAADATVQEAPIAPVARHRALVLSAGMGPGGQNAGETDYVPSAELIDAGLGDAFRLAHAVFTLPADDRLRVVRGGAATDGGAQAAADGAARFTGFVVQFEP